MLKRLRHFFVSRKVDFLLEVLLNKSDDWTNANAEQLEAFLAGETGKKLRRQLQARANLWQREAIMDAEHSQYRCGWAAGYASAISTINSFSGVSAPTKGDTSEFGIPGAEDRLEHRLAP